MIPLPPFCTQAGVHHAAVQSRAEQQAKDDPKSHGQPASNARRLSLCAAAHRLTLAELPVALCEPVTTVMRTTAPTPCRPAHAGPERNLIKKALFNLTNSRLSPADFIVLVNRFGYHEPLHDFPLDTLQPSDWLALTERALQQILPENCYFLTQLPPQAITSEICVEVYSKGLFELFPDRFKAPFLHSSLKNTPAWFSRFRSKSSPLNGW